MTATQDLMAPSLDQDNHPLPAGGPGPDRFDVTEAWYPVAYVEDLDHSRPTRFTLLDRGIVIWWDGKGETWRVFEDKCPHRLAPLSEGRVNEDGLLECPYHGWAFSGDGACQQIPQAAEAIQANRLKRACAVSMPTAVRQGLLFVYPGTVDHAARVTIPIIHAVEDEPDGWVILNTFRDLPYDALTLLENVLDASHIPYTHHKTVGNRENAAPMEMEVVESSKQGFRGVWPEGPRKGKLGTQYTHFVAPSLMYHDLASKQFGRTMTVVYATPMGKGKCRLFARFPFKFSSKLPSFFIQRTPRWWSHISNNGVLEDDQIFLHIQERELAKAGDKSYPQVCYLPTPADRYVLQFRKWVSDFKADPFPGQALSGEWSKADLLDRYNSHTRHCGSCAPALKRIQTIRKGAVIVSAVVWSLIPVVAVLAAGHSSLVGSLLLASIPLGAGALWLGLGNIERKFYLGRELPPRNAPIR
jgi:phenylpropionate dioxygenase-like ring-hydroxylating dioxygenase large terminal subunit